MHDMFCPLLTERMVRPGRVHSASAPPRIPAGGPRSDAGLLLAACDAWYPDRAYGANGRC
eukprot:1305572-Rhodomonas_salina.5